MGKCPYCGLENPKYLMYCGRCGSELPVEPLGGPDALEVDEKLLRAVEEPAETPVETSPEVPQVMKPSRTDFSKRVLWCNHCGARLPEGAAYCERCGRAVASLPGEPSHEPRRYPYYDNALIVSTKPTWLPTVGGVLAVLAGLLDCYQAIIIFTEWEAIEGSSGASSSCLCGSLCIVFGLLSIIGGFLATQRKTFSLALTGAILGMLGFGVFGASLMGLMAVLLIAVSKKEFSS